MKRKLIIGALALLMTGGIVNAQTQFGVKAGFNGAQMTKADGAIKNEMLPSFNAGLVADIGITEMFSVRTGLDLQGKGYRAKSDNGALGTYDYKFSPLYLEIPVNFTVNFPVGANVKLYAGTGPYVAFGVGGKIKGSGTNVPIIGSFSNDKAIKFGSDNDAQLKRVDAGMNVVGGLTFNNRFGVNVQYGIGLVNTVPGETNSSNYKSQHRVLGVSGIFYF